MQEASIVVAVAIAFSVIYLLPLVIHALYFTHQRIVRCPETDGLAEIETEAPKAADSSPAGKPPVKVKNCSLWFKMRECSQGCIK